MKRELPILNASRLKHNSSEARSRPNLNGVCSWRPSRSNFSLHSKPALTSVSRFPCCPTALHLHAAQCGRRDGIRPEQPY